MINPGLTLELDFHNFRCRIGQGLEIKKNGAAQPFPSKLFDQFGTKNLNVLGSKIDLTT